MKASAKSKQVIKNRTRLEWALLIALLLIAWLFLASRYSWWPLTVPDDNLGTAFYVIKKDAKSGASSDTAGGGGSGGNSSGGGSGSGSGGGNGGGSSSAGSPLLNFAAGVDTGDSKQEISGEASGVDEDCALLFDASNAGKHEVCVYTEGDKIVTVTFLNDRVISASRSGF